MDIKICDVSKTLENRPILSNINFEIGNGQVVGLIGPNGAGKTTLVRLIMNLYKPTNGEIYVNKVNVRDKRFEEVKREIGFLFDHIGLFKELNAWENLEFFDRIYYPGSKSHERRERIGGLLKELGLYERKDSKITFFSRGMRQRLVLARSMLNNPKLIILDEPSRGLDLEGQLLLRDFLLKCKKNGSTVLLNSHDLSELQKVCSHLAFIKGGRIIRTGTYNEIREAYVQNSYVLVGDGMELQLAKAAPHSSISWTMKSEREAIITVNDPETDILDWLSENRIRYEAFGKSHDELEELYQEIIINEV
ncbi:ABC transporter ATP-binding protein [Paenibacillus zanthoxyli]|uniref:ABC transporter ATP-binding protein n=1 Tax=Paenibacillus zanthoxyli TaxID=369399 RepID=UPI0004710CBF|nr:ABC transporter ATP-binding protein [Paenibacillus zanthoxyli]